MELETIDEGEIRQKVILQECGNQKLIKAHHFIKLIYIDNTLLNFSLNVHLMFTFLLQQK